MKCLMSSPSKSQRSLSSDPADPPPDTESRSDRKSRTRARLLEAMVEVGARVGYTHSSVEQVIDGTGIARSTFYEHFRDREACFLAALEAIVGKVEKEIASAEEPPQGRSAAMAVIGPLIEFARAEEASARCLFIESLAAGPRGLDLRDGLCVRLAGGLAQAWSGDGEPGQGTVAAALMLFGGTFRLLAMRLRHGPGGLGDDLEEGLDLWIRSYAMGSDPALQRFPPMVPKSGRAIAIPAMPRPPVLKRGRHRLSSAEVRRVQRERILAATAELCQRRGFQNITVTDITAAARVARNVFYTEFRDREHAATEAHELFFGQSMTAAAAAFFAEREWPERVWAAGRTLFEYWAAHPANLHLSFVDSHAIGPAAVQQTYDRVSAFTLFLEEGYLQRPANRELPRVISEALGAVMFEATYAEVRVGGGLADPSSRLLGLVYVILVPFIGVEEAQVFVEEKAGV